MSGIPDQPLISPSSVEARSAVILIIDDDRSCARDIAGFLGRFGFRTIESRPIDAHDTARREQPDLVLLDLCLDGPMIMDTRSAEHLLQGLKADESTRRLPVVAISGLFADAATEARFRRLGAEAFYAKGEVLDRGPFLRSLQARFPGAEDGPPRTGPGLEHEPEAGVSEGSLPFELTILVIDDEEDSFELLGALFKNRPYRILWAKSGAQGLNFTKTELPDLVVLDLHMPDFDGHDIYRLLRENQGGFHLPILVLTGESRVGDEVCSINSGADDYLVKGSPIELLEARACGLIRRLRFSATPSWVLRCHGAALDSLRHEMSVPGRSRPVLLTKKEAAIMAFLMSAKGRAVEVPTLHKKVCGTWKPHAATIKVHISNMRAKLGPYADLIEAIMGEESYRFNVELLQALAARSQGHARG